MMELVRSDVILSICLLKLSDLLLIETERQDVSSTLHYIDLSAISPVFQKSSEFVCLHQEFHQQCLRWCLCCQKVFSEPIPIWRTLGPCPRPVALGLCLPRSPLCQSCHKSFFCVHNRRDQTLTPKL